MKSRSLILERYDIKKLGRVCNSRGCKSVPTKELLISETEKNTSKNRELASLYLCEKHYNETADALVKDIRKTSGKGKTIERKTFNIGYVTR